MVKIKNEQDRNVVLEQARKDIDTIYNFGVARNATTIPFRISNRGAIDVVYVMCGCGCVQTLKVDNRAASGTVHVSSTAFNKELFTDGTTFYELYEDPRGKSYKNLTTGTITRAENLTGIDTWVKAKVGLFQQNVEYFLDDDQEIWISDANGRINLNPLKCKSSFSITGFVIL